MDFKQKTAIVTGAGSGIGFEMCRQLAQHGATVFLNDIDAALCIEAAGKISAEYGHCFPVPGDSGQEKFVNELVKAAVEQTGRLDIAIANAGITLFGEFLSYPAESLFRVLQLNIGGTFFLAQAAARQMIGQGNGGALLFTSSVTGHQAHKNLAAYSMTKAALEMLAKNLVAEVSGFGIRVNTVAPGATLTERTTTEPDYEAVWSRITPMGRPASVQDIAHAALFLVSDQARHITGQSLVVDGGWTATSPSPY
ncbi:SDR family NAD(P)-dependent oxidoreductase [Chitinophaga sp. NPDC101104]|uniref:SDR family NAD(P)-dependent oxidoreductase n=1 Tax=Chitinophaga sp. NPDC101104 TaxID=3390561 RepID=UPI003CFEAEA2